MHAVASPPCSYARIYCGVHYGRLIRYEDAIHPLSNAPEPKRRFVPSKWEHKTVVKMVRAIRNGNLKLGCVRL